jgi:hypothetical protein
MRTASIHAHVKRIWKPGETFPYWVLSILPDPQLLESNPAAKMKRRTPKVINSFIADGLFRGRPPQFMQLITSLARQVDAADREHRD